MDHYIFHKGLGKSKKNIPAQQKYGGGYRVQRIVTKSARHLAMVMQMQIYLSL